MWLVSYYSTSSGFNQCISLDCKFSCKKKIFFTFFSVTIIIIDLTFPIFVNRLPMYLGIKLAIFIYLWHPSTKVKSISSQIGLIKFMWSQFLYSFSFKIFAFFFFFEKKYFTGELSCLWDIVAAVCIPTRDMYWQEFSWI